VNTSIPKPYYTLIETTKGNDPAIVVVNSALRTFSAREEFPWHLKITVDCQALGANGMPTSDEAEVLVRLEEKLAGSIERNDNAVFLARITWRGARSLLFRVRDPELANHALEKLVSVTSSEREWEYRIEQDPEWLLAEPELRLLERDPRVN
jgi:hypothetical protein